MARTQLNSWQIPKTGDAIMRYVEAIHKSTVSHGPNETKTYAFDLPEGINGINIKTIRITSVEQNHFVASILDAPDGVVIYESLDSMQVLYDNVDIAYKTADRKCYVRILNANTIGTKFTIDIRGAEMI